MSVRIGPSSWAALMAPGRGRLDGRGRNPESHLSTNRAANFIRFSELDAATCQEKRVRVTAHERNPHPLPAGQAKGSAS